MFSVFFNGFKCGIIYFVGAVAIVAVCVAWLQYLTKPTTQLIRAQAKCLIEDLPLYCALFGYEDYIQRTLGPYQDTETVGVICFISPYTEPPCIRKEDNKKDWGFVFYDTNFGNGKTPEDIGQVHPY